MKKLLFTFLFTSLSAFASQADQSESLRPPKRARVTHFEQPFLYEADQEALKQAATMWHRIRGSESAYEAIFNTHEKEYEQLRELFYAHVLPLYKGKYARPIGRAYLDAKAPCKIKDELPVTAHPRLGFLQKIAHKMGEICEIKKPITLFGRSHYDASVVSVVSNQIYMSKGSLSIEPFSIALGSFLHEFGHITETDELKAMSCFTQAIAIHPPNEYTRNLCIAINHFRENRADALATFINPNAMTDWVKYALSQRHYVHSRSLSHPATLDRFIQIMKINYLINFENQAKMLPLEINQKLLGLDTHEQAEAKRKELKK